MRPDQAKQIHEDMLTLFAHLDQQVADRLGKVTKQPSCQKGCDSCCKIMTIVSLAEATTMAWPLLQKPDWRELLAPLRESALAMSVIGLSELAYAQQRRPCAFLRNSTCSVYSTRPSACRFYLVVTPASQCDASNTQEISSIDTLHEKSITMGESIRIFGELNGAVYAPLPLMVLHAFRMILQTDMERALVDETLRGLPNPITWCQAKIEEQCERYGSPEEQLAAMRRTAL
jgi:Fe-S-cluster containining protein